MEIFGRTLETSHIVTLIETSAPVTTGYFCCKDESYNGKCMLAEAAKEAAEKLYESRYLLLSADNSNYEIDMEPFSTIEEARGKIDTMVLCAKRDGATVIKHEADSGVIEKDGRITQWQIKSLY